MAARDEAGTGMTRREALRDFGVAGLGVTAAGAGIEALLARAAEAAPRHGSLKDIQHVVIVMQENRSFDHYFGTLSGVRGFSDPRARATFFQKDGGTTVHPFHLPKQCLPDLTHEWGAQHQSWDGGRMDGFLRAHDAANGTAIGPETMGYHTRSDISFFYALADAFTICDGYFCSVIGPTYPNRLLSMSGTLDPDGKNGGPLLKTDLANRYDRFNWTTMPEALEAKGVSWKVYTDPTQGGILDNILTFFKQYSPGSTLEKKGLKPTYPADFQPDLANNRLPAVSWIAPNLVVSEHPGYSTPLAGEMVVRQVVEAILSNPKVWKNTALFITWDENGGFFEHVKPPTAPPGTPGEYVTVSNLPPEAEGIRGPIGLGFRVPMLVVSPFSRGGLVCSDTFDHTSTLRFIERRFGVRVPNLSAWRRRVTGDLTSAFNFAARPQYGRPALPVPSGDASCSNATPPTPSGPFPKQEPGRRRRPSGIVR